MQYDSKYTFVAMSVMGAALTGSVSPVVRMVGFSMCVIGNIFWIWYHKNITMDSSSMWVFIAYLFINSFAVINNYLGGIAFFGL